MAFKKGQSGNPLGRRSEKPFADALRMELAAAGSDQRALRAIARNLINLAQEPSKDAMPAISAIADRLDGKPAQESTVTIDDKRDIQEFSDEELLLLLKEQRDAIIQDKSGAVH